MGVEKEPYIPTSEFQQAEVEPLLKEASSDTTELWLIQMPLNEFEPADFMGKQLSLKLSEGYGWMGCLENSHGMPFDMVNLGNQGTEPFVFLPRSSASMGVRKVARQICLQRASEDYSNASGKPDSSVGFSGSKDQDSIKRGAQSLLQEGLSHEQGTSVGSFGQKNSQVVSGTSFGGEPSNKSGKKSRKSPSRTPTASYSKNLDESGAYDSSEQQGRSFIIKEEVTEEQSSGGKRKKRKHKSEV